MTEIRYTTYGNHRLASIAYPNADATHLPVVFVHGLTASPRFWEAGVPDALRRQHAWYALGLPLHHPSSYAGPFTDETLTEHGFADLLHAQMQDLGILGPRLLVGYSVGGFAVMNYAAKYPNKVAGIVSIGGFMTGKAQGLEGVLQFFARGRLLRRGLFHLGWRILQSHPYFLRLAVKFYAKNDRQLAAYPALDPTLAAIWPDVKRHNIAGMRAWFRYLLQMDLLDETEAIQCPVLAFAGDRDPIIPFAHQREYAHRLANCRLVVLPGVGHVPFAEAPVVFERELMSFLSGFTKDERIFTTHSS